MYMRTYNSDPGVLPYFVFNNFTNGTLIGYVLDIDIGTYALEIVGIDDSG